jgi:pre-rRNA-processing protein TSR3
VSHNPTIIIRHKRENKKKCSVCHLEGRSDFLFFVYPGCEDITLPNCVLLDMDGEPLSSKDCNSNLVLLDATWRLSYKMKKQIHCLNSMPKRSIPEGFLTAYPRRQNDCLDPTKGLSSIEALFIAFHIMEKEKDFLLDHYHWKEAFLEKNRTFLFL